MDKLTLTSGVDFLTRLKELQTNSELTVGELDALERAEKVFEQGNDIKFVARHLGQFLRPLAQANALTARKEVK